VRANFAVLKRGDNQTFHISSGSGSTLKQLYHMVALLLESTIEPIHLSGPLIKAPAVVLDNTRAQRMLGWYPEVTLLEGIRLAMARLVQPKARLEREITFASQRTVSVGTLTKV
jgi:UDP-glucose 4-epimerase